MATVTISRKTDLTYEEIYEGYANGKSRLPKVLKDIQEGTDPWASLAGTTGINILRRRTGGGNSTSVTGIGVSVSTPVAVLVSASRYNTLIANYDGVNPVFQTPPSRRHIDVDVRGLTKEPFDLLDAVAGINYAEQVQNAGAQGSKVGRAAKLADLGSGTMTRIIEQIITAATQNFDVRALNNDRIGGGGATGEVHGVDLGIQNLVNVEGEARVEGGGTGPYDFTSVDANITVNVDTQGATVITLTGDGVDAVEAAAQINQALQGVVDPQKRIVATNVGDDKVVLRSQVLGANAKVDVTEANSELGFAVSATVGATLGSASIAATGQEVINLAAGSVGKLTRIKYDTYQFGTLRIFNSINDTSPVAVILHPDLLDDLVANNP